VRLHEHLVGSEVRFGKVEHLDATAPIDYPSDDLFHSANPSLRGPTQRPGKRLIVLGRHDGLASRLGG
jgi:hypothetical protein